MASTANHGLRQRFTYDTLEATKSRTCLPCEGPSSVYEGGLTLLAPGDTNPVSVFAHLCFQCVCEASPHCSGKVSNVLIYTCNVSCPWQSQERETAKPITGTRMVGFLWLPFKASWRLRW
jgi:hypothetical protein